MDRNQDNANLLDTHNRLTADIVARFRTLTMLATIQAEASNQNVDPQTIAVTGMSMQMEFEGLNSSVKELLALSRRLKELWLFGRLGDEDERAKAQAEKLDQDVVRVAELVNSIQGNRYTKLAEENGGVWAFLSAANSRNEVTEAPLTQIAPTPGPGTGTGAAPTPMPAP
ncbi:hypothetical protein VDBG_02534 [Verticillium alfalfae VaMs.102]|uniref:Cell cycle control protein n=1 Tax=Verticillium alfalfae (strain VaMs.102 / ATCC MYA-4576 / FGSC 10136) TaxID=526221 RepID=C9SDK4_VERA1|nr:hypothetical protein VDBG_02534 [Verticillium alfalfae VaMs.102]EEY16425.1 hypothetical protein VDBG_02534 [Verticillium alfalfae VaMs.102]